MTRLQVFGDLLGLSVLIDGAPADPDGDGYVEVTPGTHNVQIVVDATGAVIFDEDIEVPGCFAEPAFGVVINEPICDGDVPYLAYNVTITGGTGSETLTITFVNPDGDDFVYTGLALGEGRVLWPGAEVDGDGNPIDWPGWTQLPDGTWVEGDEFDWVRPSVTVIFAVNPEATFEVDYPPSSPDCDANPPDTPSGSVGGLTPTPTLPPTDTFGGQATPTNDSWHTGGAPDPGPGHSPFLMYSTSHSPSCIHRRENPL